MNKPKEVMAVSIKLPREQVTRLGLLLKAIEEQTKKKMTMSDLFEKIVADFLEK